MEILLGNAADPDFSFLQYLLENSLQACQGLVSYGGEFIIRHTQSSKTCLLKEIVGDMGDAVSSEVQHAQVVTGAQIKL